MKSINGKPLDNTKIALMNVAIRMFQQVGYDKTSLGKICSEIGIKGPAIYYHFKSKSDLLTCAYLYRMGGVLQSHGKVSVDHVVEERLWMFVALHLHLQFGAYDEKNYEGPYFFGVPQLKLHCNEVEKNKLIEIQSDYVKELRKILERGVDTKKFEINDISSMTFAIFGMNNGAIYWYKKGGRSTMSEIASMYADNAIRLVGCKHLDKREQLLGLVDQVVKEHHTS